MWRGGCASLGIRKAVAEILPQIRGDSQVESGCLNGQRADQCFRSRHLFGGIYTWLSQILQKRLVRFPPERVAATVNLSLIEFIYWLLGETGEGMGADGLVETIYTDLQKGNTSTARALISDLVGTLVDSVIVNKLVDALAERN